MTAMYKDAKDWLEQNASEGGISVDNLVSFILNEVSNDDIERWFGVNMDDDCDNPGAGMVYCFECHTEVDESSYNTDLDMCNDCAAELDEESEEEESGLEGWELLASRELFGDDDTYTAVVKVQGVAQYIALFQSDFDYFWRSDKNVYSRE